jgi:hypothetical protein
LPASKASIRLRPSSTRRLLLGQHHLPADARHRSGGERCPQCRFARPRQPAGRRPTRPRSRKASSDGAPIMFLNMTSATMSRMQLTDYAERYIVDRLATSRRRLAEPMPSAKPRRLRIWIDRDALAARRPHDLSDIETPHSGPRTSNCRPAASSRTCAQPDDPGRARLQHGAGFRPARRQARRPTATWSASAKSRRSRSPTARAALVTSAATAGARWA